MKEEIVNSLCAVDFEVDGCEVSFSQERKERKSKRFWRWQNLSIIFCVVQVVG